MADTNGITVSRPSTDEVEPMGPLPTKKGVSYITQQARDQYSIHGEQAAKRTAIGELIFFAGTNDLRRCKQIASSFSIDVKDDTCKDYDSRTPLHVAAAEGAYSVFQWLLDSGVNVNALDRHNHTALEEAVTNDHIELVHVLEQRGGKIWEDDELKPLAESRKRGLVNARIITMHDLGFDPEWEVNPKNLKLLNRIGGGEFGDVYKAEWHGSYVAAKMLKRSDEIALGDFRTEIATLRKVHHPNCTQFLGACTKQKPYILVTELMACSLADGFTKSLFAVAARRQVEIALDFARGMAYLHSRRQPIVHRDLKPANLMIAGNMYADAEQLYMDSGVVKVADFGLSKSLVPVDKHGNMQLNDTYKMTGETGSYRYMAPEVFRHEPYNTKVDVYSFAMILYQLVETTTPFAGSDPVEAARAAAMQGTRPTFGPKTKISPVQAELRSIVTECWSADPDKRPTFEALIPRLESLLATMPKHAAYATKAGGGSGGGGCCTVS